MKVFDKIAELKDIYKKIQKKSDDENNNAICSVNHKGIFKRSIKAIFSGNIFALFIGTFLISGFTSVICLLLLQPLGEVLKSSFLTHALDTNAIAIGVVPFLISTGILFSRSFKFEKESIIEKDSKNYNVDQDTIKLIMQYMYYLNVLNKEMKYFEDCYEYDDDEIKNPYELYKNFEEDLKEKLNDNNGKLMISDFNDLKETIDEYHEELESYGTNSKCNKIIDTLREQIIGEGQTTNVQLKKEVIYE